MEGVVRTPNLVGGRYRFDSVGNVHDNICFAAGGNIGPVRSPCDTYQVGFGRNFFTDKVGVGENV